MVLGDDDVWIFWIYFGFLDSRGDAGKKELGLILIMPMLFASASCGGNEKSREGRSRTNISEAEEGTSQETCGCVQLLMEEWDSKLCLATLIGSNLVIFSQMFAC